MHHAAGAVPKGGWSGGRFPSEEFASTSLRKFCGMRGDHSGGRGLTPMSTFEDVTVPFSLREGDSRRFCGHKYSIMLRRSIEMWVFGGGSARPANSAKRRVLRGTEVA